MVSTRKIKFNFAENEKVLCYEPDPKKAKVLYETKILECCVGKDSNGRKCPQYLVHFYGWNSSWDRIVKECDIVKDNPQNRSLQRSLAEKAAIGLKGKKLKLNKIPAIIKEIVVSSVNTPTNSSQTIVDENDDSTELAETHPNAYEFDEELTQDQLEKQSSISDDLDDYHSLMSRTSVRTSASNECHTMSESNTGEESDSQTTPFCLTNELKAILDEDYIRCSVNQLLYELPVRQNVWEIIDGFVLNNNEFLTSCVSNPNTEKTEIEENENQILIEFKSSIEIYFNALIENNYLFYNEEEKHQFKRQQLQQHSEEPFEAVKVYGFTHLLRLLVTMNDFLLSTPGMSKKQLKIIIKLIQQFIDYLHKKRHQFID